MQSRSGHDTPPQPTERPIFRRRHRLSGGGEFDAVFAAKLRKSRGPITVFLMATDRREHRLGLSIGRRVGNAVVRGRLKRMIREVFRARQEKMPRPSDGGAYDIVVTAHKHAGLSFDAYSTFIGEAIEAAHRTHEKRVGR